MELQKILFYFTCEGGILSFTSYDIDLDENDLLFCLRCKTAILITAYYKQLSVATLSICLADAFGTETKSFSSFGTC